MGRPHALLWESAQRLLALLMLGSFATTAHAEAPSSQSEAAPVDASSAPTPAASAPRDPFAQGSRYWSVTAGTSRKPSLAWFALTQLTVSYYLVDDLAIACGGQFGYVEADRTTGGAFGGPELGLRWHFAKNKRWSTYIEGLVGAVYQQHPITPASLQFNFDLQGGGGATYRVHHDTMVAGGIRSHHLSNARVRGRNRNMGYDAVMLYLGLMKSF